MSGFRLLNSETRPLTIELAREFRDMPASPTERELKPQRLKMLADKAKDGNLIAFHWATAKYGDRVVRVNGQHSSVMLSNLNGEFPHGLVAHVDHYEVDNVDGLAVLFRQFDDPKSTRNTLEVAGAWQGLVEELAEVKKPHAKLAIDGYWWHELQIVGGIPSLGGNPVKKDDRYALFNREDLHEFVKWVDEVMTIKTPELNHAAVVAAMYATFSRNETVAREFWVNVARGGPQFVENAPEALLDEWLKRMTTKATKDPNVKPGGFYQACIYAWNAHREEAQIKTIKADWKKGFLSVTE